MTVQRYMIVNTSSGLVVNTIQWDGVSAWTVPSGCTAVQSNTAGIGWTYSGGVFTPPTPTPPAPLTPMQQSILAINTGITLVCSVTPSLNGNYSVDAEAQQLINSVVTNIIVTGKFPNNQTTQVWHDMNGDAHTFPDVATFKDFAVAIASFVTVVMTYGNSNGTIGSIPSSTLSI